MFDLISRNRVHDRAAVARMQTGAELLNTDFPKQRLMLKAGPGEVAYNLPYRSRASVSDANTLQHQTQHATRQTNQE